MVLASLKKTYDTGNFLGLCGVPSVHTGIGIYPLTAYMSPVMWNRCVTEQPNLHIVTDFAASEKSQAERLHFLFLRIDI